MTRRLSALESALIRRFANDLMNAVGRIKATTRGLSISVRPDELDRNKATVWLTVFRGDVSASNCRTFEAGEPAFTIDEKIRQTIEETRITCEERLAAAAGRN
jgi:hypothetical protein